ncbi:hypothetical protein KQH61_00625 [bacterium]|nr:hypothetical protein [bacterium]
MKRSFLPVKVLVFFAIFAFVATSLSSAFAEESDSNLNQDYDGTTRADMLAIAERYVSYE